MYIFFIFYPDQVRETYETYVQCVFFTLHEILYECVHIS